MATGGIVTQPTNALVGEAGPEAIIPLDRYMDPTNGFDNSIFEKIASNTGSTNDGLKSLAQAIFKLAQIYEKNNKNTNNIVVNGQKQQERVASASEIAASNRDPIRQVRMQFAI
jgi:succinyl-CoA synthetase beta subunit